MNVDELTQEIHRRRAVGGADGTLALAKGEAQFFVRYALEPLLDHFVGPEMTLRVPDKSERVATVLTAKDGCARFSPSDLIDVDVLVFCQEDEGLLGWMPKSFAKNGVKVVLGNRSEGIEVTRPFMLRMPSSLNFETPDTKELVKMWSFDDNGWFTSGGFFLYERGAAERVEQLGQQLAG